MLALRGISKSYPGVRALAGVDFDLRAGEVHALAGENGAGKSTLLKILAGIVAPDAGEVVLDGTPLRLREPRDALRAGFRLIHQELNLVPQLSVAENLYLGTEPARLGFVARRTLLESARAALEPLGVAIDPRSPVGALSVGQQQLCEIAKALVAKARVLAMDEPTSALSHKEAEHLFGLIQSLKKSGVGIIYISHRLEEMQRLADRVTVLRDGAKIATRAMKEVSIPELIRLMVGRPLEEEFPARTHGPGEVLLDIRGLSRGKVLRDVSFEVRAGEVFGLGGLMGSGRSELVRALFGADPVDRGEITMDGKRLALRSPADAIRAGIALLPEDRKQQGLVLGMTVRENISLARLGELARAGWVRRSTETALATKISQELSVRTPSIEQRVSALSGGNQQKVVLAKWLLTCPRLLLLDEPTRGIDIGAKAEIYTLIGRLAADGLALVVVSSELPELLGLSDRIGVMHEGRLAAILPRAEATQERLMAAATGQPTAAESPF